MATEDMEAGEESEDVEPSDESEEEADSGEGHSAPVEEAARSSQHTCTRQGIRLHFMLRGLCAPTPVSRRPS